MRRRFAVALLGLCALLAGCATTVAGSGQPAANVPKPGGGPTGSAGSGAAASPTSSAAPGRQTLACGGSNISPAGAPYCFTMPAGFQDVSSSVSVDASIGQEKYRSAVAVGDRDLVIVSVYALRRDTDDVADDTLEGELKQVLQQLSQQGFSFDSTTADKTSVDGARSFGYHASQDATGLESDVYFLFRGRNELQINCQWKDKESDVTRGCKSVLDTLQFKNVK